MFVEYGILVSKSGEFFQQVADFWHTIDFWPTVGVISVFALLIYIFILRK